MLENEDIYINNIYKLINYIINNYSFEKPRPTILKKWISNIENPNGLEIIEELKKIDIWLGENPARAKKWKRDWRKRIQAWIYRTKRPETQNKQVEKVNLINTAKDAQGFNKTTFVHVCGKFCDSPCWYRELTLKFKKSDFVKEERRRLQNVYSR